MKEEGGHQYRYVSVLSCLAIVVAWRLAAAAIGASVILPTPLEVIEATLGTLQSKDFLLNVANTVLRALASFAVIVASGTLCGILAGRCRAFKEALAPLIAIFKATPVMSVILLAFIWLGSGAVPVFSAFLMAFPVMFVQTMDAYDAIDEGLGQMLEIYGIKGAKRLRYLVVPHMMPQLLTGARQTLSMVWKVVIAAEVIVLPRYGIGRSLQLAQIQLETSVVFAWTVIAIVLTALGDGLFDLAIGRLLGRRTGR